MSSKLHITEVGRVAIPAADQDRALAFYVDTLGVGPAGAHLKSLDDEQVAELRERCRHLLPEPPFALTAYAWAVRGLA